MSATMNTFPSLNAFNSRSWALAMIILLHLGFFWVFSSGLSISILEPLRRPFEVVTLPPIEPQPERITIDEPVLERSGVTLPPQPRPVDLDQYDDAAITARETVAPPAAGRTEPAAHQPLIVQPGVDPRIGLSEPAYPPQALRLGHAGTVILAVQVLENGRIGAVRVEQSSGFPRLDDAAARQAARWQLRPGTRDGAPVVMWKQIPITFRLRE